MFDGDDLRSSCEEAGSLTVEMFVREIVVGRNLADLSLGANPVELSEQVRAGWGEGSVLAITLEPKGGAPEGKATGPVVALGEVHQI